MGSFVIIDREEGWKSERLCVDYEGLNVVTIKKKYPLPRTTNLFIQFGSAKMLSRIDLCSKFDQVRV